MCGIFSGIIKDRRYRSLTREGYFSLLCRVVFMAAILYLVFTQVFFFAQMQGNGMYPAVKDGDLLIGYRLEDGYQKDDVVWYDMDGAETAGRVVAVSGDVVTITDGGGVLVNGTSVDDEILYATDPGDQITYPYTVPEGSVFLLGDYRTQATDSRTFGAVSITDIKGKILTLIQRESP